MLYYTLIASRRKQMIPYLIALDLDGTLLTEKHQITTHAKNILKQLKNEGHKVMIATGRPFHSSEIYYRELELNTPIINHNGAYVHTPGQKNADVQFEYLNKEAALSILKELEKRFDLVALSAEQTNTVYLQKTSPIFDMLYSFGTPNIIRGKILKHMKEAPISILVHSRDEETAAINEFLEKNYGTYIEHRCWGMPTSVIEITKKGINKAEALKKIARQFQIERKQIMTFGDQDNDLEMIDFAGVGVAMGNAHPKVKAVAKHITDSNEQDGVAKFLEKYFAKILC